MCGHEGPLHDDVVAGRAAQADDVPDVVDHVVGARDEDGHEVDRPALLAHHQAAQQRPGGVLAAGGESPPARQLVAARDRGQPADRRVGGGDEHVRARPRPPPARPPRTGRSATRARRAGRPASRWSRRPPRSPGRPRRRPSVRPPGRRTVWAAASGRPRSGRAPGSSRGHPPSVSRRLGARGDRRQQCAHRCPGPRLSWCRGTPGRGGGGCRPHGVARRGGTGWTAFRSVGPPPQPPPRPPACQRDVAPVVRRSGDGGRNVATETRR